MILEFNPAFLDGLDAPQAAVAVLLAIRIRQKGIESIPYGDADRFALLGVPPDANAAHLLSVDVQRAAVLMAGEED